MERGKRATTGTSYLPGLHATTSGAGGAGNGGGRGCVCGLPRLSHICQCRCPTFSSTRRVVGRARLSAATHAVSGGGTAAAAALPGVQHGGISWRVGRGPFETFPL